MTTNTDINPTISANPVDTSNASPVDTSSASPVDTSSASREATSARRDATSTGRDATSARPETTSSASVNAVTDPNVATHDARPGRRTPPRGALSRLAWLSPWSIAILRDASRDTMH